MTRLSEMANWLDKTKPRTPVQVAELGLQSAEDYHQQYLYKVPGGYCPDHSTGVSCPIGLIKADYTS
jgi:peptide methionine sulfoxide reductase MsrA